MKYYANKYLKVMNRAFRTVTMNGQRVDGRLASELRPIKCSPDVLPHMHGSSFFARGDTHVLCTTTLGSRIDAPVSLLCSFQFIIP